MTSVPPGTLTSRPSMVRLTIFSALKRAPLLRYMCAVLVGEVLDAREDRRRRAVAERAERPSQDVVGHVGEHLQVVLATLSRLDAVQHPRQPEASLPARRALA